MFVNALGVWGFEHWRICYEAWTLCYCTLPPRHNLHFQIGESSSVWQCIMFSKIYLTYMPFIEIQQQSQFLNSALVITVFTCLQCFIACAAEYLHRLPPPVDQCSRGKSGRLWTVSPVHVCSCELQSCFIHGFTNLLMFTNFQQHEETILNVFDELVFNY